MTDTWWRVTLHHRDSGTYPRSVVSVEPYDIGKDGA